ncbi:hypothetical protein QZH41_006107 [Actinostola sp. cb2023]|nr:hypothetical protein QZH41_006107 [Actinostola sp. cb2023]
MIPWWAASAAESPMVNPPLWSWWGLQSQRLSNLYRFPHFASASDDEKPSQSYIGLIAEAILSSPEEKLILSDIYGFILANYPYFRNKGTGWRNSIRHNLSLNECFIKDGRSQNGKGHFWAINHLYLDDFRRGDFRRKRTYKRPSRGKKARAKLDALMKRKASSRYHETTQEKAKSGKMDEESPVLHETFQDNLMTFKTEQIERQFVDDTSVTTLEDIKEETFLEPVQACGEPQEGKASAHERVVPSSPERTPEDYQEVDADCKTDFEKESVKSLPHGERVSQPLLEESSIGRIEEMRARRTKPFDMDTLLAPERSCKDLGILREMYPMYYNIMNLGMRNVDPVDCYGPSPSFCGHCSSMLGSFPSPHRDMRRHFYPVTAFGMSSKHEESTREYMH